jgi:hypothetical protein
MQREFNWRAVMSVKNLYSADLSTGKSRAAFHRTRGRLDDPLRLKVARDVRAQVVHFSASQNPAARVISVGDATRPEVCI